MEKKRFSCYMKPVVLLSKCKATKKRVCVIFKVNVRQNKKVRLKAELCFHWCFCCFTLQQKFPGWVNSTMRSLARTKQEEVTLRLSLTEKAKSVFVCLCLFVSTTCFVREKKKEHQDVKEVTFGLKKTFALKQSENEGCLCLCTFVLTTCNLKPFPV